MKHIILFTDCLGAGGAQRQLVGLATMLKARGYNVKVCTYFDIDFYKSYLDENEVPNEVIPDAASGKRRFFSVYRYFKKEQPDAIIAYQETPSMVACVAKLFGCKFKLIVSERNTTQNIKMSDMVRFFLYRVSDAIVPNSYSQERWLKSHYPWMETKINTITNFVDLENFYPVEHQRRDVPEILVAASIWPSKNTMGLVGAISQLRNRGLKFHVSWYGKSDSNMDYYRKCESFVKSEQLEEYVDLLPKTKEIHLKYREADYFCLPSFYEGTPNVLCEAIASGLPVMVSNVCDNAIYAETDKNAVLFDPNSPTDMANSIELMLTQTNEAYQMCRNKSRKIATEKLSKTAFLEKYLELLEQL